MISVVVTLGDMLPEQREPVIRALRHSLGNPAVSAVHVLTEAALPWLPEVLGDQADRLSVHAEPRRPSFSRLIAFANSLLPQGPVALMNADVSLAGPEDVRRLEQVLVRLQDPLTPPVLALARHEQGDDGPCLGLYESSGLPNLISADAWIFAQPVILQADAFYCPGQMNCDMMLAYDLIEAGHMVFNPCLDVTLLHFEPSKQIDFYDEKNAERGTQELLWRHVRERGSQAFNYYRVPWVSARWLLAGYRPQPLRTHGASLLIALDGECPDTALVRVAHGLLHACELLVAGDPETAFDRYRALLCARPDLRLVPVNRSLADVRRAYLEGSQYSADRVALVHDLAAVTPQLLDQNGSIFVAHGRPGRALRGDFGCTLVTSVFRSETFLQGFLNNTRALKGYGPLIDHIFLVAQMTPAEVSLLDAMLQDHPNVMIIWHRKDPGLYACWNIGIKAARRRYVSNANVDDLRDPAHVETLIEVLETHPETHVAATALNPFYEFPADGSLPEERAGWYSDRPGRFGFFDLGRLVTQDDGTPRLEPHNMPHCMPVWRRSLHAQYGWFDEARYGTYADWAFWMKTLRRGGSGWLHPEALSFYFVNPTSHNRRGDDLARFHGVIEAEFMPAFQARATGQLPPVAALPAVPRKLALTGMGHEFGQHRNSFNKLIEALLPLDCGSGGVAFLPFIERYFVWGDAPGEARSAAPEPITRDWVGILHVPFDAPDWFEPGVKPETIFQTELWQKSLPHCRGLITLARDLEADLNQALPQLPSLSALHPVDLDVEMFEPRAYHARPQVVQVGDWLRKLQAIHRLRAPGHKRIMLLKAHTQEFLRREIAAMGDHRDPGVDMRLMVPNDAYDHLLATSVVLCLLYGTAANNLVIECIARATPILINPLPAVVEYLGPDYPLYARDEAQADLLLLQPDRIDAAHAYLKRRRLEIDLSYEGFLEDIATSSMYRDL